jgi:hypothetical protein
MADQSSADQSSHTEQGQIERAKRLREHIDRLKKGQPEPAQISKPKSLKEQVSERSEKPKK